MIHTSPNANNNRDPWWAQLLDGIDALDLVGEASGFVGEVFGSLVSALLEVLGGL